MTLMCLNIFINGKYTSSEKIDSRILLDEYRSVMPLAETMVFLHNSSSVSLEAENELRLCDIIQNNNEIRILDNNIETDISNNPGNNVVNLKDADDDNDVISKDEKDTQLCCKKRTRMNKLKQEGIRN